MLKKEFFINGVSSQDLITKLSNPENAINVIEAANLVFKYAIDYICSASKIRGESINFGYEESKQVIEYLKIRLLKSEVMYDRPDEYDRTNYIVKQLSKINIEVIFYQLKMLLDLPKTLAIFLDIIRSNPKNISEFFTGIDLGTGSGILLLAQYILAKRLGFSDEKINLIGIEINDVAVKIGNTLSNNMGFGKILQGNTTDKKVIRGLVNGIPTIITNENLPNSKSYLDKEPFLENLLAIRQIFQKDFGGIKFFPSVVYCGEKKYCIGNTNGLDSLSYDFDVALGAIVIGSINHNGKKTPLTKIGDDYNPLFLENGFYRWI